MLDKLDHNLKSLMNQNQELLPLDHLLTAQTTLYHLKIFRTQITNVVVEYTPIVNAYITYGLHTQSMTSQVHSLQVCLASSFGVP